MIYSKKLVIQCGELTHDYRLVLMQGWITRKIDLPLPIAQKRGY